MITIKKFGYPKAVWVTCLGCKQLYYIDRPFYESQYDKIPLHCTFCHLEFAMEDSSQT